MRIKHIVKAAGAVVLTACAGFASAQTASSSFTVTANVNATCTISTTNVAFGTYDPLGTHAAADLDATGSVTIICTKGTGTKIGLNGGGNPLTGNGRQMSDGTKRLAYSLYKPLNNTPGAVCAYTQLWGDLAGTDHLVVGAAPSKNSRTYKICGRIAQGLDAEGGNYSDTVDAVVEF